MRILVFNAGSSSLKFGVFDCAAHTVQRFKGGFERFQDGSCAFSFRSGDRAETGHALYADLRQAIAAVPQASTPSATGLRMAGQVIMARQRWTPP